MRFVGTRTDREASFASASQVGAVAELFFDAESFDIYCCVTCSKAELFLA